MAPMGLTASMSIDEVARDLIGNSAAGIVGEVMNLDDFLDEVSDPDPKLSPRSDTLVENTTLGAIGPVSRVFNPLANLDMMFNTSNYSHYEAPAQVPQQQQQLPSPHSPHHHFHHFSGHHAAAAAAAELHSAVQHHAPNFQSQPQQVNHNSNKNGEYLLSLFFSWMKRCDSVPTYGSVRITA